MESFRFGKAVQRVVVAGAEGAEGHEGAAPSVLYAKKKRKKKGSPGLRLLGKLVRGVFHAQRDFGGTYEEAHDRSNGKKKDGWLRDLPSNVDKAGRAMMKKLRKKL
jgi:hypothetical protein